MWLHANRLEMGGYLSSHFVKLYIFLEIKYCHIATIDTFSDQFQLYPFLFANYFTFLPNHTILKLHVHANKSSVHSNV